MDDVRRSLTQDSADPNGQTGRTGSTCTEGSTPDQRSATTAVRTSTPRSQEIRMSRITTARGAAVLAAVAASALALSACTAPGGSGGTGGEAADTSVLVIGLDSDQAALGYDPLRYGSGQRMFFEGVYDSLFLLDEEGQVVPDLVTNFEYNEDQTQLTLDLDTGA